MTVIEPAIHIYCTTTGTVTAGQRLIKYGNSRIILTKESNASCPQKEQFLLFHPTNSLHFNLLSERTKIYTYDL
jgi:hypothetical protein